MLRGLAKTKALQELKQVIDSKASLTGLAKTKVLKRQNELRLSLGMGSGVANEPQSQDIEQPKYPQLEPLNENDLLPLAINGDESKSELAEKISKWVKQVQGKTIVTVDGKEVRFSRKTTTHISTDIAYKEMIFPRAATHLFEVLKTGKFVGVQNPDEPRSDFKVFHVYRKWVDVSQTEQVNMQVKIAELNDGTFAADNIDYLVYTVKDYEKDKEKEDNRMLSSSENGMDSVSNSAPAPIFNVPIQPLTPTNENSSTMFDGSQDDKGIPLVFEILEIRQKPNNSELSKLAQILDSLKNGTDPQGIDLDNLLGLAKDDSQNPVLSDIFDILSQSYRQAGLALTEVSL